MQTIWSRVAQVRGTCRCPQCVSTVKGVSRRATASATRRTPKYLTSSTLWYSGIFAAAATFDAGVKNRRREQWALAIADVKQELEQTAATGVRERLPEPREAATKTVEEAAVGYRPFSGEDEDVFHHVDPARGKPRWPTNTGQALRVHHLPPQSIYADEKYKTRAEGKQWSVKKLAMVQLSMDIFQLKLFLELEMRSLSKVAATAVPEDFAAFIQPSQRDWTEQLYIKQDAFAKLKKADSELSDYQQPFTGLSICQFSQSDLDHSNRMVRDLNRNLQDLFRQHANQELSKPALIAKISHNLCSSLAPPNLNTFNTLILGLSKAHEPDLTGWIIESFRRVNMRPNETSLVAVLNHYTRTNQGQEFAHWVGLMRGKHNGLMLAKPGISISDAGRSRLVPQPDDPTKVIQLPYPTPNVFGAVIAGVIKFAGFEKALSVCQNMGQHGWGLCMAGLTPLLESCVERGDWNSGTAVWDQIQALKAISRRKDGSGWKTERIQLHTYAAMLRLCSRSDRKDYFDKVWDQAMRTHESNMEKLTHLVMGTSGPVTAGPVLHDNGSIAGVHNDAVAEQTDELVMVEKDGTPEAFSTPEPNYTPFYDHRSQTRVASNVLSQLQAGREEARRDQGKDLRKPMYIPRPQPSGTFVEASELLEQQLHGNLPSSFDLDEYDLTERPMALNG